MIVPGSISRRYKNASPVLDYVANTVRNTVLAYCEANGFAYVGRKKTVESLAEKVEGGRYPTWGQLDDLFGCAVIIPTLSDEKDVVGDLLTRFNEVSLKRRGTTKKSPDVFRFDATRFVGRLASGNPEATDAGEYAQCFEIQIRSAFEHAWSVTTHALAYKAGKIDWRVTRLASQMKAAVEQLDGLALAFNQSLDPIVAHEWPEITAKQQIQVAFAQLVEAKKIPDEMEPDNWTRFADNLFSLLSSTKGFARNNSVQEVDRAIKKLFQNLS